MDAYTGFEPQVGEIRALRTFRVGPDGVLYPLFNDRAWSDATNTARCRVSRAPDDELPPHVAPAPDCTCGFYAYASEAGALEYPTARHVLAVISSSGHVIAGTKGIRAEHARIEAIWMSGAVPPDLAATVAARYPNANVFADKHAMLDEHPPTVLDCYQLDSGERSRNVLALRLAILIALVIGVLPTRWLAASVDARIVWAGEFGFFLAAAALTHRNRFDPAGKRQALLFVAVVLWVLAPYAGTAGTLLLRLPLLQIAGLTTAQRMLLRREAARFPARIGPSAR